MIVALNESSFALFALSYQNKQNDLIDFVSGQTNRRDEKWSNTHFSLAFE